MVRHSSKIQCVFSLEMAENRTPAVVWVLAGGAPWCPLTKRCVGLAKDCVGEIRKRKKLCVLRRIQQHR